VLIPLDDYPIHQSPLPLAQSEGGHPDFYDRFFLNGYDEDVYFALALGTYPNRGVIDAAFATVTGDKQRSVFASGRAPLDRAVTAIGPIAVEILEPMRSLRIRVDAPEHGLQADLTFATRTPVCEEERQVRYVGPRRVMDVTRATQLGRWTGWFSSGGERREPAAPGFTGTKDRSWGVRPVGDPAPMAPIEGESQLFFVWTPLQFDDECLHCMIFEDAEGVPWSVTAVSLPVIRDGEPVVGRDLGITSLAGARHEIDWAPGLRRSDGGRLRIRRDPSREEEVIELEPLRTFRMSGIGYGHPVYRHGRWHDELLVGGEVFHVDELDNVEPRNVHVQQVVRATWGDRIGIGTFEQMAIGPHAPSGFTEQFDGAPALPVS
jgi:hypothetical protein